MSTTKAIIIFFACCTLTLAASITEMQATQVSNIRNEYANFYYASLAGANDLAFTTDEATHQAQIMKRNANGMYNLFAIRQLRNASLVATTNGEWFGSIYGQGVELFRVDENGQTHDYSIMELPTENFAAQLQQDGSLMVAFTDSILTYEFVNAEWIVTKNTTFAGANFVLSPFASAAIPNNAFIVIDDNINADNETYNIFIITYQADKSWKIVETVAVNKTFLSMGQAYFWDGANTFMCTSIDGEGSPPIGALFVFTKTNGVWKNSQSFSPADVGVGGYAYFGVGPLVPLNNDNVLVAAPADNILANSFPPGTGSVYLMQRNQQNEWNFVAKFTSNTTLFSAGMAKNDQDALVLGCSVNATDFDIYCSLFTFPKCVIEPIDFTCSQQRDTCSTDLDDLVVINNPLCGKVSLNYDRIDADKNGIEVDVILSRPLVADATCSVTLTCSELLSVSSGKILTYSTALIIALASIVF
jgi:hypothetical protein